MIFEIHILSSLINILFASDSKNRELVKQSSKYTDLCCHINAESKYSQPELYTNKNIASNLINNSRSVSDSYNRIKICPNHLQNDELVNHFCFRNLDDKTKKSYNYYIMNKEERELTKKLLNIDNNCLDSDSILQDYIYFVKFAEKNCENNNVNVEILHNICNFMTIRMNLLINIFEDLYKSKKLKGALYRDSMTDLEILFETFDNFYLRVESHMKNLFNSFENKRDYEENLTKKICNKLCAHSIVYYNYKCLKLPSEKDKKALQESKEKISTEIKKLFNKFAKHIFLEGLENIKVVIDFMFM